MDGNALWRQSVDMCLPILMPPEILLGIVNTVLLVLSWIPPVLHLRIKIIVTIAYLGAMLAWLLDGRAILMILGWIVGHANWRDPKVISDWQCTPGYLAQFCFIGVAISVLIWVAIDVSNRRNSPYPDEPQERSE